MKKVLRSPVFSAFLLLVAVFLLALGSVGGTRAALTYYSQEADSTIELDDIGVCLTERYSADEAKSDISYRNYVRKSEGSWNVHTGDLITKMVEKAGDEELKIGKEYPLYLGVRNSGTIPTYVRVTVYKYWVDAAGRKLPYGWFSGDGTKRMDFDPGLIEIIPTNNGDWYQDTDSETPSNERMVFYYRYELGRGEYTSDFTKALKIESGVYNKLTTVEIKDENDKVIGYKYSYDYDGVGFVLDVQVDSVQNNHYQNAMKSAWGIDYSGK